MDDAATIINVLPQAAKLVAESAADARRLHFNAYASASMRECASGF